MLSVYSGMPEVWVRRWRTVMPFHRAGAGTYFETGSSNARRPSSASRRAAAAANCFPVEPDWNTVSGFTGTWCSTLARPKPAATSIRPSRTTASARPGIFCSAICART